MIEQGNIFGGYEAVDESFQRQNSTLTIKQRFRNMYGYDCAHICKDCKHLVCNRHKDKNYYKCELMGITNSEATDIRLKDVACGMWERKEE